ncbi:uncharacterized protein LOC128711603 [Anopheles marshallii]|uniref:uncharacterized protein LOC128711603 n=1 Tax=Anopheles marshallii TaxID=1521116 RepID=UPI00237BA168|nr:uncharacterized protein LOC128711603 [Anopheles marshallii]
MVPQVARLWATALLLATLHKCDNAAVSVQQSPAKSSCLAMAGAIFDAPPIQCQPLVACSSEEITQRYLALHEKCRVNATQRHGEREHFLFRINYWQGDHEFLYGLVEKAHQPHPLVLDAEQLAQRGASVTPDLNRKLFIYSIEAGRIEDALLLYLTMENQWTMQQIMEAIENHPVYKVTEAVVLHLLEFARGLPLKRTRVEFYKALVPVMRRYKHLSSYVTLLYAGDALPLFSVAKEKKEFVSDPLTIIVHRLRSGLRHLKFDYNVWIANKYPRYYTLFLEDIFFIPQQLWPKLEKRRLFEITSLYHAKGHRFQALTMFLKHVKFDSRDKNAVRSYLPTLALQVDNLLLKVKQTGNHKHELDRVQKLQDGFQFGYYNHKNIYRFYLNDIKVNGKFGKQNMELEKKG